MDVQRKLEILADAAKYDASCASSGTEMRDSSDGKGLGSTAPGMGICQDFQLALHLHTQIPLIPFMNRQTVNSIDSSVPVSFKLEHIMNK